MFSWLHGPIRVNNVRDRPSRYIVFSPAHWELACMLRLCLLPLRKGKQWKKKVIRQVYSFDILEQKRKVMNHS